MRVIIAISRSATVEPTYTTIHIAAEALQRGHQVRFVEPWDFEVDPHGRLIARAHAVDTPMSREALTALLVRRDADRRFLELGLGDTLLLRINPIDQAVLVFARLAQARGVLVHNSPSALTLTGHKAYLATLTDVRKPKTLVTKSRAAALHFAEGLRSGVIVKPARSSGGRGVGLARAQDKPAIERAFSKARKLGDAYVVVQEYLPGAERGEKRLIWLNGELIGGYLRTRAQGDFRHNIAQGGSPTPCRISRKDRELTRPLTPHLLRDGVWFAGLDVIDGHLVEINTLNPGGVHYGDQLNGTSMASTIVEHLERERKQERT